MYYILCDRTWLVFNRDARWKGEHICSIVILFLVRHVTLLNDIMLMHVCKRDIIKVCPKQPATQVLSTCDTAPRTQRCTVT